MKLLILFLFTFFGYAQGSSLISTSVLLSQSSSLDFGDVASGGDSFGGGDSVDTRKHTAWFYGDQPIQVCYQLSSSFGLESSVIEKNIQESISSWQNYFKAKQIDKGVEVSKRVNRNFKLKSQCQGGEDLVLYFGTGPIFGNLDDMRARQMLSRPVAYVNKTHMTQDLKWSKGYIRFVEPNLYHYKDDIYFPVWTKKSSFYNLLSHELGHVLGFVHTEGTIMRKSVSKNHFIDDLLKDKMVIDDSQELYNCSSCKTVYSLKLSQAQMPEIKSIEINEGSQINFILSSGKESILVEKTLARKNPLNLLSFFSLNSYKAMMPYFYFIKYKGVFYTIEVVGNDVYMRLNGQLINQFKKEEEVK